MKFSFTLNMSFGDRIQTQQTDGQSLLGTSRDSPVLVEEQEHWDYIHVLLCMAICEFWTF